MVASNPLDRPALIPGSIEVGPGSVCRVGYFLRPSRAAEEIFGDCYRGCGMDLNVHQLPVVLGAALQPNAVVVVFGSRPGLFLTLPGQAREQIPAVRSAGGRARLDITIGTLGGRPCRHPWAYRPPY